MGLEPVSCTVKFFPLPDTGDGAGHNCAFPGGDTLVKCTFGERFQKVQAVGVVAGGVDEDVVVVLDNYKFTLN